MFPIKSIKCPYCGESLLNKEHKIDGYPSVEFIIRSKDSAGWLRLSSLYGSYNKESELKALEGEIVRFFCPHCDVNLRTSRDCEKCNASQERWKGNCLTTSGRACYELLLSSSANAASICGALNPWKGRPLTKIRGTPAFGKFSFFTMA